MATSKMEKREILKDNNILEWFCKHYDYSKSENSNVSLRSVFDHYMKEEIFNVLVTNRRHMSYSFFVETFKNYLIVNSNKAYTIKNYEIKKEIFDIKEIMKNNNIIEYFDKYYEIFNSENNGLNLLSFFDYYRSTEHYFKIFSKYRFFITYEIFVETFEGYMALNSDKYYKILPDFYESDKNDEKKAYDIKRKDFIYYVNRRRSKPSKTSKEKYNIEYDSKTKLYF